MRLTPPGPIEQEPKNMGLQYRTPESERNKFKEGIGAGRRDFDSAKQDDLPKRRT